MKNSLVILLLTLPFVSGFGQELWFDVSATYVHPVKKEALAGVRTLQDINPGYPASWITNYISVEVSATCDGRLMKEMSQNDTLSAGQKNILNTVDLGSDIVFIVNYHYKNAATDNIDVRTMMFTYTLVPEVEAEYADGYEQMKAYLKKNAVDKIQEGTEKEFRKGVVKFTVSEDGEITGAYIATTSGDEKTDKLLLKVINKMPKWKPAQTSAGYKVKQDFVFNLGNGGC